MRKLRKWSALFAAAIFNFSGCAVQGPPVMTGAYPPGAIPAPVFAVDAAWPKPLPNRWILGQVAGVAVDSQNHIWIVQRPRTLTPDEKGAALNPPLSNCCVPAPPVIEFDQQGNVLQAWGGPGQGYDWPVNEHGIYVDPAGYVWVGGNDAQDGMVLKFTNNGQFVMQIGHRGKSEGSNSKTQLGRPAGIEVDPAANEVYIADGYQNRRVIVFDATTGQYKRHWGAYGHVPEDGQQAKYNPDAPLSQQFGNPVHCARLSHDGLVYVCDRSNDRVQVFDKGGRFLQEFRIEPRTLGSGSVWDMALSNDPQQAYLFIADGGNNQITIVRRDNGQVIGIVGRNGRQAGQFHWVHNIAIDHQGNLYTAEVDTGKRVQRFVRIR